MNAIIITIGDELLIGQTIDTNAAWMASQMCTLGIDIIRKYTISDTADEIKKTISTSMSEADVVIMTGGLGPTKDDITKATLAQYFDVNLKVHETTLEHIKQFFARRNRPFLDINYDQSKLPENCMPLFNREGTAPGMWFEDKGKILVSMPGVPFEMRNIMLEEVIPRLAILKKETIVIHQNINTCGIGESFLAEKIKDIEDSMPSDIKLAYLPSIGTLKLRLTARGSDKETLRKQLDTITDLIKKRVPEYVFATDETPLEEALVALLQENRLTLATAESCTAGSIATRLGNVSGVSYVYKGSIVSYANEIKTKVLGVTEDTIATTGAVSEATVVQMAKQCQELMNVDIAISVSGILGPSGGTQDKPLGLVWMAMAYRDTVEAFSYEFPYDRIKNKELATVKALDIIRKKILESNLKN